MSFVIPTEILFNFDLTNQIMSEEISNETLNKYAIENEIENWKKKGRRTNKRTRVILVDKQTNKQTSCQNKFGKLGVRSSTEILSVRNDQIRKA